MILNDNILRNKYHYSKPSNKTMTQAQSPRNPQGDLPGLNNTDLLVDRNTCFDIGRGR